MKKIDKILILVTTTCLLFSCSSQSKQTVETSILDDCDIVATIEVINGDSVIICDYNKIKQRKNVPLDELVNDFTILKLDNENDQGLIGKRLISHIIGERYIVVFCYGYIPVKLYDKQGKYLRDIGKFGQGPGEYAVVDNVYLDEEADRVYVLPYMSDKVLVYDFEGNNYPPIHLLDEIAIGNSIIPNSKKKELIVTKSPLKGNKYSVWVQDFEGNLIQAAKQSDYFGDDVVFSASTLTRLQTANIEFFSLNGYNTDQYLYHYNIEENRLVPKFRMKNMDKYWIFVYELPNHFVVEVATDTSGGGDFFTPKMIIDKYSLKGCHFNGFVTPGGILFDQYNILANACHGNFGLIDFGSNIMEKIEKADKEKLSLKSRQELEKLQQLIEETDPDDDCSLLFYGKFKQ